VSIHYWYWNEYPRRDDILGFDPNVQKGTPFALTSFQAFNDRWGEAGGLQAFQNHLAKQLVLLDEMV